MCENLILMSHIASCLDELQYDKKTNYVSFRIVLMHYTNIEYLRYLCKKLFKTNQGFLAVNPFTSQ